MSKIRSENMAILAGDFKTGLTLIVDIILLKVQLFH